MSYANRVRQILARTTAPASRPARTGMVPGKTPSSGKDNKTIPAESGEYVIPAAVVAAHGKDYFDKLVMDTLGTVKVPSGSPQTGFREGGLFESKGDGEGNPLKQASKSAWWTQPSPSVSNDPASSWTRAGGVTNYQEAVGSHLPNSLYDPPPNPTLGNGPFGNPDPNVSINRPFGSGVGSGVGANVTGVDPRNFSFFTGVGNPYAGGFNPFNTWGYQPPAGTPGATQGPTPNQTWFDPQGFPYGEAVPVTPDVPYGKSLHTPAKSVS